MGFWVLLAFTTNMLLAAEEALGDAAAASGG
jgi:hypothetical protein